MREIKYISLNNDMKFNKKYIASVAFILFFCDDVLLSIFSKIFSFLTISQCVFIVIGAIYIPLFIYIALNKGKSMLECFIFLFIIGMIFFITYLFHPEYIDWFTKGNFSIQSRIFRPTAPLYAYVFFRVIDDPKELFENLKIVAIILFMYYFFKYVSAMSQGYWLIYDASGKLVKLQYSLDFGYDMLFPSTILGYCFYKEKKIVFLIMYIISLITILLAGSRGPLLCVGVFIILIYIESVKKKLNVKQVCFMLFIITAIFIALIVGYETILMKIGEIFNSLGLSSRSIEKLIDGSITDENGRDIIYGMAKGMISEGGIFGYGAYGDRYVIGQSFYWGYCHNLFFELLISFGVLGGGCIIIILLYNCFKMIFLCKDDEWRGLFIVLFACSCKLILSSSFWYCSYFWAGIALVRNYNKTVMRKKVKWVLK